MYDSFRPTIVLFTMLTLLTGVVYPVVVTFVAQAAFGRQANGSVLSKDGKPIGSELIGQPFDGAMYFWGRPSATSPTPYNAGASSGSNLGPTNPAQLDAVRTRIETIRKSNPDRNGFPPIDLVTGSASGLDPHISPAAAEYQIPRVAKARGLREFEVRELVTVHTEGRTFGVLGERRVNVLELNLALDEQTNGRR